MCTPLCCQCVLVCVCVCELNHLLFFHRISSRCISLFLATVSCVDSKNIFLRCKKKILSFLFVLYDGSTLLLLSMATSPGYSSSYQSLLDLKKKERKKKQQKIPLIHTLTHILLKIPDLRPHQQRPRRHLHQMDANSSDK